MEFESIRVGIALLGCFAATYYDLFNNRNVPNVLTYGMVIVGFIFAVLGLAVEGFGLWPVISVFGPAVLLFLFGYYFYINGQIGGADILMFVAIALLIPQQPPGILFAGPEASPLLQIPIPYVISVFLVSGVLFSASMFLWMLPRIVGALMKGKVKLEVQKTLMSLFLFVLYGVFLWNMAGFVRPVYLAITGLVLVSAFFVYIFKDFILDEYVVAMVPLNKIDEEDVLAVEKMDPELVKKYDLKKLLTASELERLKKVPIKEYPVYKNMPCFMPYVTAAVVITLLIGDLFTFMMQVG